MSSGVFGNIVTVISFRIVQVNHPIPFVMDDLWRVSSNQHIKIAKVDDAFEVVKELVLPRDV